MIAYQSGKQMPVKGDYSTVEPRFNEPLYNELSPRFNKRYCQARPKLQ